MKLTFPHLGNAYVAIEALLEGMGHTAIVPPRSNNQTLAKGSQASPEEICLPFKIILGNMLEGLELGAEGVLMIGGFGPCRLGYYGEIQKLLLEEHGYEGGFFTLEVPRGNFARFRNDLTLLFAKSNPHQLWRGCQLAWAKLTVLEDLENQARFVRPREKTSGSTSAFLNQKIQALRNIQSMGDLTRFHKESKQELNGLHDITYPKQILRVGILGEIYTVLEPLANLNMEARLGVLGVEVVQTIFLRNWIWDHVFKKIVGLSHLKPLQESAQSYLRGFIGGHGLESVARSVDLARTNVDGILHVYPLSCMPEVVAQGILTKVSGDYDSPILSLVVDEHSSEVGFQTRLEAFVDLMERRVERGDNWDSKRVSRS